MLETLFLIVLGISRAGEALGEAVKGLFQPDTCSRPGCQRKRSRNSDLCGYHQKSEWMLGLVSLAVIVGMFYLFFHFVFDWF